MQTIVINAFKRIPYESDEEPGMPTFELTGTVDGAPFTGRLSVEQDGRDVDYKHMEGVEPEAAELMDAFTNHDELVSAYNNAS